MIVIIVFVLFTFSLGDNVHPQQSKQCVMDTDVHELLVKMKCELINMKEKLRAHEERTDVKIAQVQGIQAQLAQVRPFCRKIIKRCKECKSHEEQIVCNKCDAGFFVVNGTSCKATPITVTVSPTNLQVREGEAAVFMCRSTGPITPPQVRWTFGNQVLPSGSSDVNGRLTIGRVRMRMSGDYVCQTIGIPGEYKAYARLEVDPFGPPTQGPPDSQCGVNEAICHSGQCINREHLCDGDFDCYDRSDEADCINPLPCEPNEFQCDNGKCALKIWRCDGDNDCGDMTDEKECPTANPGSECSAYEYQCVFGGQCIQASYQCDGEIDCLDRSDEIGCVSPTVLTHPPPFITVDEGKTIQITCVATGVPTPLIVWRLNRGNIGKPPRVTSTSVGGRGVLTITSARPEDNGAYTCEALNNKGSVFSQKDTIVTVKL